MRAGELLLSTRVFLRDGGFFGQHHGNFIANRKNAPAGDAFQPGFIRQEFYSSLTHRAYQNVEGIFGNRQDSSSTLPHE